MTRAEERTEKLLRKSAQERAISEKKADRGRAYREAHKEELRAKRRASAPRRKKEKHRIYRGGRPSTQIGLRVPDIELVDIDRLRGEMSRCDWIRDVIRQHIAGVENAFEKGL